MMTLKSQVTIPVEIRHLLGLKAKDKIAQEQKQGKPQLKDYIIPCTSGSLMYNSPIVHQPAL